MTLEEHKYLGSEEIKAMSTIFKKETKRPLTNYQKRINEAAQELCLANPGLLQKGSYYWMKLVLKSFSKGFSLLRASLIQNKIVMIVSLPRRDENILRV